jgi:hypothetical protein
MTSETEIIIAFVFKRSGKTQLGFSDFYLTLSMDLNWFTPEAAKDFVNQAVKQKLLTKKEDQIKPAFDIKKITVPVGFYPSKKVFIEEKKVELPKKEEDDVFKLMVERIIEKSNLSEQEVIKKIKEIEREKNITPEIAALLVGKEYAVPLEEFYEKVERRMF